MYRIALRVAGVDLDDDATFDAISCHLSELTWMEIDGRVLAVLHTEGNPAGPALQAARHISSVLAGSRVLDVDQDLVGVSDIAKRVGVTREAVRLWVDGKRGAGNFPQPVGSAGSGERGSMRLWQWASVNDWLRQYGLHDEEDTLSAVQAAEVNAALLRVMGPIDRAWQQASTRHLEVAHVRSKTGLSTNVGQAGRETFNLPTDFAEAMTWHERLSAKSPG